MAIYSLNTARTVGDVAPAPCPRAGLRLPPAAALQPALAAPGLRPRRPPPADTLPVIGAAFLQSRAQPSPATARPHREREPSSRRSYCPWRPRQLPVTLTPRPHGTRSQLKSAPTPSAPQDWFRAIGWHHGARSRDERNTVSPSQPIALDSANRGLAGDEQHSHSACTVDLTASWSQNKISKLIGRDGRLHCKGVVAKGQNQSPQDREPPGTGERVT